MLVKKNILKNSNDKTYDVFTNYITSNFLSDPTLPKSMKPSAYVTECWERYKRNASSNTYKRSNSLNGKIFEVIIATALYRCKVRPFYLQAKARLVPDVDYDIILYDKTNQIPITISVKTSVRERYKQADLEAYAFRNVHRAALNYLVLLNKRECANVQKKIKNGSVLGLKQAIRADSGDFDVLLEELKQRNLGTSPKISLFEGQRVK